MHTVRMTLWFGFGGPHPPGVITHAQGQTVWVFELTGADIDRRFWRVMFMPRLEFYGCDVFGLTGSAGWRAAAHCRHARAGRIKITAGKRIDARRTNPQC